MLTVKCSFVFVQRNRPNPRTRREKKLNLQLFSDYEMLRSQKTIWPFLLTGLVAFAVLRTTLSSPPTAYTLEWKGEKFTIFGFDEESVLKESYEGK